MDAAGVSDLSFRVTVRGTVRSDMRAAIIEKWPGARGGFDPMTESPYMTVPCQLDAVEGCLQWLIGTFPSDYTELVIGISTSTKLGWGSFVIPSSVALSAHRHGARISVNFSCDTK
jgi:hypothetical protein